MNVNINLCIPALAVTSLRLNMLCIHLFYYHLFYQRGYSKSLPLSSIPKFTLIIFFPLPKLTASLLASHPSHFRVFLNSSNFSIPKNLFLNLIHSISKMPLQSHYPSSVPTSKRNRSGRQLLLKIKRYGVFFFLFPKENIRCYYSIKIINKI